MPENNTNALEIFKGLYVKLFQRINSIEILKLWFDRLYVKMYILVRSVTFFELYNIYTYLEKYYLTYSTVSNNKTKSIRVVYESQKNCTIGKFDK